MLFDPAAHEPLTGEAWSEERARAAVRAIVAETEEAFDPNALWPAHPLDDDGQGVTPTEKISLYLGAAGIVWALDELARTGAVELRLDWTGLAASLHERYLAAAEPPYPSLWIGEAGILLVAHRLAPSAGTADRLHDVVRGNVANETNELMWGSPGTMLAARAMLERTGDERWRDAWSESAERLWDEWAWDEGLRCHLWTQRLYGRVTRYLGPAHGFSGAVLALAADETRRDELARRATEAVTKLAVREDGLANWEPRAGEGLHGGDGKIRVQWCHGAPGIVASLAEVVGDEDLLRAGGELTWTAGPLVKGPGLCHGTAGNGYAFLKLFRRTGDELWLERARAFAMHAAAQVERARTEYGRGRFSLWSGDLGAALYLWHCVDGTATVPTVDVW